MTDRDVTNRKRGLFGRKSGGSGNQPMAESGQTQGQQAAAGENV